MTSAPRVAIYGLGRAGLALAASLAEAKIPLTTLWSRSAERAGAAGQLLDQTVHSGEPPRAEAELVFLAVTDAALAPLARQLHQRGLLPAGATLAHLAGALPAAVLDPGTARDWWLGALHPLRALAGAESRLQGGFCALDGEPEALAVLTWLVEQLGCPHARVGAEQRALYHAGAALAANDLVALADRAARALQQAGLDAETARSASLDLMSGALDNVARLGPAAALTGPLVRGEHAVIAAHLDALDASAPASAALHRAASLALLDLADRRGLDPQTLATLRALLTHDRS